MDTQACGVPCVRCLPTTHGCWLPAARTELLREPLQTSPLALQTLQSSEPPAFWSSLPRYFTKAACGHKKSQQQIAKLSPSEVWFGLLPSLFPWPLNILHRKKSKKKHPHPPTNKALSKCQKAEFHKQRQHSFGSIFKKSVLLKKSLH